jgi:DnaJ-domain-containing protein 1
MRKKIQPMPSSGFPCAVEGCPFPGDYKAPKSRYDTGEYQYLCLDHIREFNKAWDYFDGWDQKEIEDFMDDAMRGHRPTWKIGSQPVFTDDTLRDSFFKMLGEKPPGKPKPSIPRKEREAFATMDLEPGAHLILIKAQYKKLVKKHHPDVNKGDKQSEETFKRITAAYTLLVDIHGKHNEN